MKNVQALIFYHTKYEKCGSFNFFIPQNMKNVQALMFYPTKYEKCASFNVLFHKI